VTYSENLITLHDAYTVNPKKSDVKRWEAIYDGLLTIRTLQKNVKNLLVEDALYRKALSGDVRACLTWLSFRMSEWNAKASILDFHAAGEYENHVDDDIERLLNAAVDGRKLEGGE